MTEYSDSDIVLDDPRRWRLVSQGICMIPGCRDEGFFLCPRHALAATRYELLEVLSARARAPHCTGCGMPLKNNGRFVNGRWGWDIGHPLPPCDAWMSEYLIV